MNEKRWVSWKMQTSRTWEDIQDVLKLVQIDFIDYDHKILVEYALKLNQLIKKLDEQYALTLIDEIGILLNDLYQYAVEHFDREELFMEKYDLPHVDVHKIEHKRILDILSNAITEFQRGKVTVGHELKLQVMEWLIHHINVIDFNFFRIENWSKNLINANDWESVKDIISLTGVNEVDEQHKRITEQAIEIFVLLDEGKEEADIIDKFNAFAEYVMFHFSYEEDFMKKFRIQETSSHHEEHRYFENRLKTFPKDIIGNKSRADEFKSWLLTWWINHINVTDFNTFLGRNWVTNIIEEATGMDDMVELLRLTNIGNIDQEHLTVMEMTFNLHKLISDKSTQKRDVEELLVKIYDVAEMHFAREEAIMKKYQMIDYSSHHSEHMLILKRLKTMLKNYQDGRLYASKNIKTMILDWWISHTNTVDYRTFVINLKAEEMEKIREEEQYVSG